MEPHTARAEAERWLGISAKLLTGRDLVGSKTFAIRAREADPSNPIADQILAVVDTLIAAEKRVINSTNYDWYSILQLPHLVRDPDVIASQYGRLVMLLNPEHNGLPYADLALRLVVDAWSVLSDPAKKWMYDSELTLYLQRNSTPSAASVDFHQVEQPPESVRVDPSSTFQFFQQPPQPQPQPQPQQPQQWLYHHQPQQPQPQLQERQLLQQQHNPPPPQAPPQPQPQRPTRPIEQQIPPQPQIQQQQPVSTHQIPPPPQQQQHGERGRVEEVNGRARNLDEGRGNHSHNVGKDGGIANNYYDDDDDDGVDEEDGGDCDGDDGNDEGIESFWTTCPYCYYTYEYPKTFQDCTLRCQNCRRAFQAVQIPNPPPMTRGGKETSYCCWGFFPVGFSMTTLKRNNPFAESDAGIDAGIGVPSSSMPFSPVFATQQTQQAKTPKRNFVRGPVVYLDDDDDFDVSYSSDDSDTSDDLYRITPSKPKKKKRKSVKGRRRGKVGRKSNAEKERLRMMNQNSGGVAGGVVSKNPQGMAEMQANTSHGFPGAKNDVTTKAGGIGSSRKPTKGVRGRKKLDLNVEFSNEVEEHAPTVSAGNGEEEVGFFEGLDEFLSTLPLLHPVGDDKAKPS